MDNELVKDPRCQTYIPINTAFRKKMAGKNLYFCSEECMDRYVPDKKKGTSEDE
jgi:YHS domain-containing protein